VKPSRITADPKDVEREFRLGVARQTAQDVAPSSSRPGSDPFAEFDAAGGLWALRARLARAVLAANRRDPAAVRQHIAAVEPSRLGLDGLDTWLGIAASLPKSATLGLDIFPALNGFAERSSLVLATEALWHASLLARTPQDRSALRNSLGKIPRTSPERPRLSTRRTLIEGRLFAAEAERAVPFAQLLEAVPDAPERFADLFDKRDITTFDQVARTAPLPLRIARARTLIPRKTDEGIALLTPYRDATAVERFAVAETLALGGRLVDARTEFSLLQAGGQLEPALAQRVPALLLSLEMRICLLRAAPRPPSPSSARTPRKGKGRRGKSRRVVAPRPPAPSALPASTLLPQTASLLRGELDPQDRRRLLSDAVRLAKVAGRNDEARQFLSDLVTLDPGTTAGAEDLFRDSFQAFQSARGPGLLDVAKEFETQANLYKDNSVRRRATYWAARARAKAGDQAAARNLFSSLLSSGTPDLYGHWAAAALGIPYPTSVTATTPEPVPVLTALQPGPMEREFLAAGLPDMAEEAAEVAGRVSPLLSAFAAWERREFRRAVILLKRRFPELGTQNEAAVPLSIRRLYYPSVHTALIETAATEKNIPLPLVLGLIRQESIFESDARSWAGAIGLMQVMPATGKHLYRTEHRRGKPDLLDPAVNVHLGTRYIADMLRIFQGDVVAALAAYNAGPGRVARWKREMAHLEMDEFVESMPLSEPRDYVKKVLFFKAAYSALYGLPSPVQVDQNGTRRLQIRFASSF
jgi:soluble lytic murein transglycosylase-like protein